MTKEWQLVDSRLDDSHPFQGDFYCIRCSKPRALHKLTDFRPSSLPSTLGTDPKASYRGHVYWARPGGLSHEDKIELAKEQRAERLRIDAAIAKDKEAFRAKAAKGL